jgi:integrase
MSVGHFKPSAQPKPERPEGSPLFWHASGRWAKKIRGRFHYFGRGDHAEALALYLSQKDELHSGRVPEPEPEGLTVHKLAKEFLQHKHDRRELGYLAPVTYRDYETVCQLLKKVLGKDRLVSDLEPDDFSRLARRLAQTWGPVRVFNFIVRIRGVFKFGVKQGLVDRVPNYGPGFDPPPRKVLRLEREKRGPKLFTAEQIRNLLDAANPVLRAMVLLGINCGLGNADCARLGVAMLDLDKGWLTYPRPKTGVKRKACLWPETVAAVQAALACRPQPTKGVDPDLVFITCHGVSWHRDTPGGPTTKQFTKLARRVGISQHQGLSFYSLRHTFRTVADESLDQFAIDRIMGHARDDMASVYRERISDERLMRVSNFVRGWLFGNDDAEGPDVLPISKIG